MHMPVARENIAPIDVMVENNGNEAHLGNRTATSFRSWGIADFSGG